MEMVTMKQYMAESKLPESALRPVHYDEPLPTSTFTGPDDDDAWKAEFGAIYQQHHYWKLGEKKKNFCAFGFRSDSAFDPTWVKWYSGVYNHVINIVLLEFMMVLLCNCLVLD